MLTDADLPALYRAADDSSMAGQAGFLWSLRTQLTLLVVAAAAGAITLRPGGAGPDWAGVAAAASFIAAALLRIHLLTSKPERTWYEGRAAAESAKTLAWRYAVGGQPFPIDNITPDQADALLVQRLRDIVKGLQGVPLAAPANASQQITERMRALRTQVLKERKQAYETWRIQDQHDWYSRKARWNGRRVRTWSLVVLSLETGAAVGAILKATGALHIDLLGVAGAAVAGAAAWLQAKQHATLSSSYSVAAQELAAVRSLIATIVDESQWATFVDSAEEAISREHTMWKASRS